MTVVHRSFCRRLRLTLLAVLSAPTSAAAARPVTIAASRTLWPISPAIRATIFTRVGPLLGTGCRSAKVFVEASAAQRFDFLGSIGHDGIVAAWPAITAASIMVSARAVSTTATTVTAGTFTAASAIALAIQRARLRLDAFQPLRRNADHLFDHAHHLGIFGRHQRGRESFLAGAARAADAMHVIVRMDGHIVVEDVTDIGNVEAARGDVGGRQKRNLSTAKAIQRRGARALIHVAVQRTGIEAVADQ